VVKPRAATEGRPYSTSRGARGGSVLLFPHMTEGA